MPISRRSLLAGASTLALGVSLSRPAFAAIAFRSSSTGPNSNGTSTTISLPTGTTTGDVTIIAFSQATLTTDASLTTVSPPAGWTTICNIDGQGAIYRLWQSGDPSSVTLTSTASKFWETVAVTYSGCDGTNPIDVSNSCMTVRGATSAPSFKARAPSVNPNFNSETLVGIWTNATPAGGVTLSFPGGLTSRVATTAGPCISIGDLGLTNGTPTGDLDGTWSGVLNSTHLLGCQVTLKPASAAGASVATATARWATVWTTYFSGSSAGFTVPLSRLNIAAGDFVCVWVGVSAGTYTAATGYSTTASQNGNYLFTRSYQNGDADPAFTQSSSTFTVAVCLVLRKTGVGGINPTIIDTVQSIAGSGNPNSVTFLSETLSNNTEYVVGLWLDSSNAVSTFTNSSTLTTEMNFGTGPGFLFADAQSPTSPTGTLTGGNNLAVNGSFAGFLLPVSTQSAPPPPTGRSRIIQ